MSHVSSATVADPRLLKAGFAMLQGDDIDFIMRTYDITLGRATAGPPTSKTADVGLGAHPSPSAPLTPTVPQAPRKLRRLIHAIRVLCLTHTTNAQVPISISPGSTRGYTTTSKKVCTACISSLLTAFAAFAMSCLRVSPTPSQEMPVHNEHDVLRNNTSFLRLANACIRRLLRADCAGQKRRHGVRRAVRPRNAAGVCLQRNLGCELVDLTYGK